MIKGDIKTLFARFKESKELELVESQNDETRLSDSQVEKIVD